MLRKAAAVAIAGTMLPLMVDAATDPYGQTLYDRGLVGSWLAGARTIGIALAVAWAVSELEGWAAPGGSDE